MTGLRDLIAAYRQLSWRDWMHMVGRWRLCPMTSIASYLPDTGVIIDLGCGHGLFTHLVARESPQREVYGVDLDARKIEIAQQAVLPNLHFRVGDIADVEIPPAQAVTILDVFYLVPYDAQERLLKICWDRLASGGVLLLKDMAEKPRWKAWLNWVEEVLAVRVLRITLGGAFYFRPCAEWQALFRRFGFAVETIPLDRGYYHPHVLFVAHKNPK
jgi:trans-aconitate methyltransferase